MKEYQNFLGVIDLTSNQIARLKTLHSGIIVSFNGEKAKKTLYCSTVGRYLTDQEIEDLRSQVILLSNDPLPQEQEKIDFSNSEFNNLTQQSAEAWIESNVTDLASAKLAMKKMARAIVYLLKR